MRRMGRPDPINPIDPTPSERLAEAVRRSYGPPLPSFDELDRAVMRQAEYRLASRRSTRWRLMLAGSGLAAAASVALGIWLFAGHSRPPAAAWTLDSSRPTSILDAFRLARLLEAGAVPDAAWDVTGDGTVNGADVEELKRRAVKVPGLARMYPARGCEWEAAS